MHTLVSSCLQVCSQEIVPVVATTHDPHILLHINCVRIIPSFFIFYIVLCLWNTWKIEICVIVILLLPPMTNVRMGPIEMGQKCLTDWYLLRGTLVRHIWGTVELIVLNVMLGSFSILFSTYCSLSVRNDKDVDHNTVTADIWLCSVQGHFGWFGALVSKWHMTRKRFLGEQCKVSV